MVENNQNFDCLESIIKVEPEEFQEITIDEVLASRVNIISEPIVLLERLTFDTTNSYSDLTESTAGFSETAEALAVKGNYRLHASDLHTCCVCQKVFANRKSLKNHLRQVHCKANKFICDRCPEKESFDNKEVLRRHNLKEHYGEKLFECYCGSVFKYKNHMLDHQQIHDDKLKCEVCQKQFSTRRYLANHWRKYHLKTQEKLENIRMRVLNRAGPFICDSCGSKSINRKSFRSHRLRYHVSASLFCDLCPRSFTRKHLLSIHIKRVHLEKCPLECHVCSHKASSRWGLKMHMLRHGQKIECKICHKLVSNMYHHLRTHKLVKCSICSKIYPKHIISRHIKTHQNSE